MKLKQIKEILYNISLNHNKSINMVEEYIKKEADYINENVLEFLFICFHLNLYFIHFYTVFNYLLNEEEKYELLKSSIEYKKESYIKVIIENEIDLNKNLVNILSLIEDKVLDLEGVVELILLKTENELSKEQQNFVSENLRNKINYIKNLKEF